MNSRVYKLAALALICLTAISTKNYAQQSSSSSSSSSSSPAKAPTAAGQSSATSVYSYSTPMASINGTGTYSAFAPLTGVYTDLNMLQDSAYRKKMQKLQEQMRDLQKEMSSLRTEEFKKASAERTKQYALKFKESDLKFATKFSSFGQRFNSEKSAAELDKKVQAGEIKLKTKSYTKSYNVDANDKLQIDNRFGKITVNAWNKNEIKVDVEIKAYADDDDKAKELLDLVSITDSKNSDGVNFTTKIGDENHKNNFWGTMTTNGKTSVRSTVINYTVYMPTKNALTISNMYGSVILPDMSGKVTLKNQFGNLITKTLTNTGNDINLKYVDANIESLTGSDLNVSFGTLNLQSADKLNADFNYVPVKIGKLSTSGNINIRFGEGVQIITLDKNLKALTINSSYAPVKLAATTNADFYVSTNYGAFTYDNNNVSVTTKSPSDDSRNYSNSSTYKGHIGKGDNDKLITIKSSFSSVKFDQ
ncbi:MAG: hypothetical protein V4592_20365 [Bacteroidota bacterium]